MSSNFIENSFQGKGQGGGQGQGLILGIGIGPGPGHKEGFIKNKHIESNFTMSKFPNSPGLNVFRKFWYNKRRHINIPY